MNNKNVMKVLSITLVLSLLMAILPVKVSQVQAVSTTYCVDPEGINGCYNTIGEAVTAAQDGDTIEIHAGFYVEKIEVTEKINLIGVVDEDGNGPVIEGELEISDDSGEELNVENITFKHDADGGDLLVLSNGAIVNVINCSFDGWSEDPDADLASGINLDAGNPPDEVTVEKSIFKNGLDIAIYGTAGDLTVKNSVISDALDGIEVKIVGGTLTIEKTEISLIVPNDEVRIGVAFENDDSEGGDLNITGSTIVTDAVDDDAIFALDSKGDIDLLANWNIILGKVENDTTAGDKSLDATNNWWGSTDGPSEDQFPGDGGVDSDPWLKLFVDLDNLSIDENQPIDTVVGNLSGVNGDPDEVFTYRLAKATTYPDNLKFKVEGNQLKSKAVFNFEEEDEYDIGVIVEDAWGNTAERPFTITINDVNEKPILEHIDDQEVDEYQEGAVTVTFDASVSDVDTWQTHKFSLEGAPDDADIDVDGVFTWTLDELDGPGSYTFTVKVCDNGVPKLCDFQAVTITVNEVNQNPTAHDDAYWFKVGTTRVVPEPGILGNDEDNDRDPDNQPNTLTAEIVDPPDAGSLILNPEGSFTFVPPAETVCSDPYEFTYKVSDGQGGLSTEAKVTLTCKPGNVNPTEITLAPEDMDENKFYEGKLTAADTDDNESATTPITVQHTYALIAGVGDDDNAKFEIEPGTNILKSKAKLDFETQSEYHIHVQATDPFGGTFDQPLTIGVTDVNEAPILDPIVYDHSINEGESLEFTAFATDEDSGDVLEYSLSGAPVGAVIDGTTGRFTWTPSEEILGPKYYEFDVIVTDDDPEDPLSAEETIKVTVNEVNVAPVLTPIGSMTFTENVPVSFYLRATDADLPTQALRYGVEDRPANLWVNSLTGLVVFYPDEEQGGEAYTFTFKVCDNGEPSLCDEETVRFTVTEDNQAPVANGESYAVIGSQLVVPAPGVLANDIDEDIPADTLKVHSNTPRAGLVVNSDGSFTYTVPTPKPELGYVTFTYIASDGEGEFSEEATVYLLIDNHVPTNITLDVDTVSELADKYVGTLSTTDPDEGDVFTYEKVAGDGDGDNALFTIDKDQLILNGPFNFEQKNIYNVRIRSTDLFGKSVEKALSIHVEPENEEPIADSQDLVTLVGESLDITLTGSDPEGDALTFAIFSEPKHGQLNAVEVERISVKGNGILRIVEPQLIYVPDEDYLGGYDSFTFKARDVHDEMSDLAIVNIIINDIPVAEPDAYPAIEDTELTVDAEHGVLANDDNIIEVPPFRAELVSGASHGELHLAEDGSFTYMPELNYNGVDTFTYKACEGSDCSNVATVTINIAAVNDAPIAEDSSETIMQGEILEFELQASDVDGDRLTYTIVQEPEHGILICEGPQCAYIPEAGWFGVDTLVFKVSDGTVDSNEATVEITVLPLPEFRIYLPIILK